MKIICDGSSSFCVYITCYITLFHPVLASENDKEKLLREVSIMLPLNHPNVMSLIGLCFDGEVPLVIMPYMSDGSVLDYVQENRENLFFTDHPLDENVNFKV